MAHLSGIRFQDDRHITGQFDKIASSEMLEAVGEKYLETYFAKCAEVLAPHGILAVQMITVPDHHFRQLAKGTDWIQKHIFPGSLLLAVGRVNEAIRSTGPQLQRLWVFDGTARMTSRSGSASAGQKPRCECRRQPSAWVNRPERRPTSAENSSMATR